MTLEPSDPRQLVKAAWVLGVCILLAAVILVAGVWWALSSTTAAMADTLADAMRRELSQTLSVAVEGGAGDEPAVAVRTAEPVVVTGEGGSVPIEATGPVVIDGGGSPLVINVPEALAIQGPEGDTRALQVETGLPLMGGSGGGGSGGGGGGGGGDRLGGE